VDPDPQHCLGDEPLRQLPLLLGLLNGPLLLLPLSAAPVLAGGGGPVLPVVRPLVLQALVLPRLCLGYARIIQVLGCHGGRMRIRIRILHFSNETDPDYEAKNQM
jgi:hypothetical protein